MKCTPERCKATITVGLSTSSPTCSVDFPSFFQHEDYSTLLTDGSSFTLSSATVSGWGSGEQGSRWVVDAVGQAFRRPAWAYMNCPCFRRTVLHFQVCGQSFMQDDGCGLDACVGKYAECRDSDGCGYDGDDGGPCIVLFASSEVGFWFSFVVLFFWCSRRP